MRTTLCLMVAGALCVAGSASAQQTGSITGRVTTADGSDLPGVTVEASSPVLPRSRATVSGENGEYRLPLLPPGEYTVTFKMDQMADVTREAAVLLQQDTIVNASLSPTVGASIDVTGAVPMLDPTSAELKSAVDAQTIDQLPVGQEYRDLVKLIPGVTYTEENVRGPSAGGSGQDNVYQFDGVNVTLPLFGTLSAEPSSHDIDQISVIKGGAKATDFNRSGGFTINSISKSGTNAFHGEASYQVQTEGMTAERETSSASEFEQDEDWATFSLGGPVIRERLYFYFSYYRPTVERDNRSNFYGEVPNFESTRDELFGKLSFNPTNNLLIHASLRDSDRENRGASVGLEDDAGSTSEGSDTTQRITILEGSWVLSSSSFATFRYTDYENENSGRPDTLFDIERRLDGSVGLDVANLDQQGFLNVPNAPTNPFLADIINRYGYTQNGIRVGGGSVGGAPTINDQDFFRESFEVGFDFYLGTRVEHELHFGFQRYQDEEELARTSNGWGTITVPGGTVTRPDGTPVFFEAVFQQMGTFSGGDVLIDPIVSEYESDNIELNDTIRLDNFTFNIGFLVSNDRLFGQGLRENSSNVSGFELDPSSQYQMYELDWEDMIQPRLGAVWSPNQLDSVFVNYARYLPAASSLPRAASWARNTVGQTVRAYFDASGNLIDSEQVGASSGKFFQEDLDPRTTDEYLVGYSKQISPSWAATISGRYRKSYNFWEDTNNNARVAFEPPAGIPQEDYIDNLAEVRAEIGGSSYVIAELDGAENKFYEVTLESEWRGDRSLVKGSYAWGHYYGNFDQDDSTTDNDQNIFIGSSNIADGAGRQLWDNKYGNLHGDRRHKFKIYGYYELGWNASLGAFAIYQSGAPWEAWNSEVYRHLTSSTSNTIRFAEPAGSRTSPAHYQLDLNYTQNFPLADRFNIQLRVDVFNVSDNQTGYAPNPVETSPNFGEFTRFYEPRRFQVALKLQF